MDLAHPSIQVLAQVVATDPLQMRVLLALPDEAGGEAWVPRTLRPLGYFVTVVAHGPGGEVLYESDQPKAKPKLDPRRPESYLLLESGYCFGATLTADGTRLPPGPCRLEIGYDSREFTGPAGGEGAPLRAHTTLSIEVGRAGNFSAGGDVQPVREPD